MEQQELEIKGILVEFFRNGTNGDYLDALNGAIDQLKIVKNHGVSHRVSNCPECGCNKITGDGSKAWCLNEKCNFITSDC